MEDKDLIKLSVKELMELGVCPTCLNRRTSGAIYGDDTHLKINEDNHDLELLLTIKNMKKDPLKYRFFLHDSEFDHLCWEFDQRHGLG